MKLYPKAGLVLGAVLLLSAPAAFAGAGVVTSEVVPLSTTVTYSRAASPSNPALATYIGYRVNITSSPLNTNTINNVRFTATTSVTDAQETAIFSSSEGRTCYTVANPGTSVNDGRSIECPIGQLRPGDVVPEFLVFFAAPAKDIVSPTPDGAVYGTTCTGDCVTLSSITYYAEGTGGVANPGPDNSSVNLNASPVALGTCNPTTVKSALPKSGGTFFTDASASCATDPFAVAVTVDAFAPTADADRTVELVEQVVPPTTSTCLTGNFVTCYGASVEIPAVTFAQGSGNAIRFVLLMGAANINSRTKITDVVIRYTGTNYNNTPIWDKASGTYRMCPTPTTPFYDGLPCVAKQTYYKNKSVPGWTPQKNGAFEFELLNNKNGFFTLE